MLNKLKIWWLTLKPKRYEKLEDDLFRLRILIGCLLFTGLITYICFTADDFIANTAAFIFMWLVLILVLAVYGQLRIVYNQGKELKFHNDGQKDVVNRVIAGTDNIRDLPRRRSRSGNKRAPEPAPKR